MSDIHEFEAAGLGKAPFRVVGMRVQKGGVCDFCNNALVNNFLVESADGRQFTVGSDCVKKTGDAGLAAQVKQAKRQHRIDERRQEQLRKAQAVEESLQQQRQRHGGLTDKEVFMAQLNEGRQQRLQPFIDKAQALAEQLRDHKGGFRDQVADQLQQGQAPAGRAVTIIAEILAKGAGHKGSDAFVRHFDLVIQQVVELQKEQKSCEEAVTAFESGMRQRWQQTPAGQWREGEEDQDESRMGM